MLWRFTFIKRDATRIEIEEPVGWDSMDKTISRDETWHGIFFKFSQGSIEFAGDAYWMIKEEYINYGVDGYIGFLVEWMCDECEGYQEFFNGELDFQQYNENCAEDCSIKIGIDNSTSELLLKNRMDTAVDLTNPKAYDNITILNNYVGLGTNITVPGKKIKLLNKATKSDDTTYVLTDDIDWLGIPTGTIMGAYIPSMDNVVNNELNPFNPPNADDYNAPWNSNYPYSTPIYIKQPQTDLRCLTDDLHFKGRFKGTVTYSGGASKDLTFTLLVKETLPSGVSSNRFANVLISAGPAIGSRTWNVDASFDFSVSGVPDGTKYYFLCFTRTIFLTTGSKILTVVNHKETFFQVEASSLCDPSPCKMFMLHESISRVLESISNNGLKFKSAYYGRTDSQPYSFEYDGEAGLRSLTNGLLIRRALLQDNTQPKFSISLKEILEGLNAIDCIGMGIEGTDVRLEPIRYFYDDDVIFVADNVESINSTVITSKIYNQYSFGYDKYITESNNGLDAIHTKREYRLQITHTDVKLEKYCKMITDGYAIEETRRKFGISNDWRYDNNSFLFCLKRGVNLNIVGQTITFSTSGGFNYISIVGNYTASIQANDILNITGSSSNNGTFTAIEVTLFGAVTNVKVAEAVVYESTSSARIAVTTALVEINNIDSPSNFYDAATVINYRISPIHNAMKWFKWVIQGIRHLQSSAQLIFNGGDGNIVATGKVNGGVVYENTPIAENSIIQQSIYNDVNKAKCFIVPQKDVFKYPMGIEDFLRISASKYKRIKYRHLSTDDWSYGWIMSLKYIPEGGIAEFQLVKSINN